MRNDIRQAYDEALNESHHGRPTIVEVVHTGQPGRPAISIDPDFLRWAYSLRSTSSISRFLGVSRQTVRNALLEHGITSPQQNPFLENSVAEGGLELNLAANLDINSTSSSDDSDPLLNPDLPIPSLLPSDINSTSPSAEPAAGDTMQASSYTGPLSSITDGELDELLLRLRSHYCRAGITMLDGMLRRLGHRIQRERIRQSLTRIDPVQRVFERIRIRRRVYSVPGPNSLWHHDGQHGMDIWIS